MYHQLRMRFNSQTHLLPPDPGHQDFDRPLRKIPDSRCDRSQGVVIVRVDGLTRVVMFNQG